MNPRDYFASDYADARARFLAAAGRRDLPVASYAHPLTDPEGRPLATDAVKAGAPSARRFLVLNSATHGVEGFCGSGALVGTLEAGLLDGLPASVGVLLIHAINPHGFAWLRRVTEDNVDLNRNFLDHDAPHPVNAPYADLHDLLIPDQWTDASVGAANAELARRREAMGAKPFQTAVSGGQYSHPDGVFFGGHAPTWSNRTLRALLAEHLGEASDVLFYDFHTGLGPYGNAEMISGHPPDSDAHGRLLDWLGDGVTSAMLGTSNSTRLSGTIGNGVAEALPRARHTKVTLEYGTKPLDVVLQALRADAWLHNRGDLASPLGRAIKREIRDAFYRDEDDWKELVWLRARQLVRRGIDGLARL